MQRRHSLRVQLALSLAMVLALALVLQAIATVGVLVRLDGGSARIAATTADLVLRGEVTPAPAELPLRRATPLLLAYLVLSSAVALIAGVFLLDRWFVRRVDQLAARAERIGRLELDEALAGESRGGSLGHLDAAFRWMAAQLKEEQGRTRQQIAELKRLNSQLGEARDSLARAEKLATVGRLAAGVAHEIGNPLGAILGYLELARARGATPEVLDNLVRIDREVARIDRTIRELLEFSRPSASPERLREISLRESVDSAVRLAAVQRRLKGVHFEVDVSPDLRVLGDPHRLSQVLINVLLNAGDAMNGEGMIEFRAHRAAADPPDDWMELAISDSGPGIPEANLSRVFDPFFTTKEPGSGTGLGLSICHSIMESFDGQICACNGPRGGATITLRFRAPPATGR